MEPSSLPRQMIPSGASDRDRTNQLPPSDDERGSESQRQQSATASNDQLECGHLLQS